MAKIKSILLLPLFLLVACAGPYNYKDSGSRIELSEDDSFQVVLDGDANSAFSWELTENPSFVSLQLPVLTKTKGSIVEYTFDFKTVAQGEESVVLIYTNGEEVRKSFELTVVVGTFGPIYSE